MKYFRALRSCLRQDSDSRFFVFLPLLGIAFAVNYGHWELAMGLVIATLTGIYAALNYPEAELGRRVRAMMGAENDHLVMVDKHPDVADRIRLRSYPPKKADG